MKRLCLLIFLLCLMVAGIVNGQPGWRPGEMEIRVKVNSAQEAENLAKYNLTGDIYSHAGYALLYVIPEELDKIKAGGYQVEILKADLIEFAKNFWSSRDQYHSYDEIIQTIDNLSGSYPDICEKYDFGSSVEGRQLVAIKISDNADTDENEPEIMFDGGIHGDEIGGPENLIRFAEFLCDSYSVDPEIANLIDTREIWLYIMVNPDGRVNMVRYNSHGVDLNRDWGFMWDGEGSSPDYYSQVETRALRDCMLDNQFVVHTCYHSGREFVAYPWSYRPDSAPDQAHLHQLASIYSSSSGYPSLLFGQGYSGLYPINGSSKDAAYGSMGSVAWTMEISTNKQPPSSEIQYYYDINEPAMLAMIEYAGYGINGTISDTDTGDPVAATIFINNYYPCYSDPAIGDYHKYLLEGTYTVTAVANGYQSQTLTAEVSSNSTTELNFTLVPQNNHFAYRVIATQIPITNFADEASTHAALWEPDGINYSTGRSGWIILDMQSVIPDGPGEEIMVYEGDSEPEGYSCYASLSMDGPWFLLGGGTGTASFNFSTAGITEARYIRIIDDGNGDSYGDNIGFDLDAIEVLPQPEVIFLEVDCYIDDTAGNDNSRIDPGESFNLIVTLRNLGSMPMENGSAYLNFDNEFFFISNPEQYIGDISFGETLELTFAANCSSFCPQEELLLTVLNINSNDGIYQESFPLNFTSGLIVEDWENGNLTKFDWETYGNKDWAIYFLDPYQGIYSAKSGNIDDNQISAIEVTLDVVGYDDISFYRKVSSEDGSDFLRFYIDNNLYGEWSGDMPWEFEYFQVKPGVHTFKWSFEKDHANSNGSDGGWIDYIVFPSCNLDGTMKVLANAIPHNLCGSGESQLGGYVVGGTGNYTFEWTPSSTIDDSTIQFPVATPVNNTSYAVNVDDGQNMVSSVIEVILLPIPESPVIMQEDDKLLSSSAQGNQWFDSNGPIAGATGQHFYPPVEEDYFVIVTNEEGCESDTSNIIHFIFTGIDEPSTVSAIHIFPNPFDDVIQIKLIPKPDSDIMISIKNLLGIEMAIYPISVTDLQDIININSSAIRNGIYLITVIDPEGKILASEKIIKL